MRTRVAYRAPLLVAAASAAMLAGCQPDAAKKDAAPPVVEVANGGNGTVTPVPLAMPGFPVDSVTIDKWINNPAGPDSAQIRAHAWAIWAGLTQLTDQKVDSAQLPVYETWPTAEQVFNPPAAAPAAGAAHPFVRSLHVPRQFGHASSDVVRRRRLLSPEVRARGNVGLPNPGVRSDSALVMVTVSYNTVAQSHVRTYGYTDTTTLDSLNTYFNAQKTPVAQRNIVPFPDSAVALKPTYLPVSADGLTIMPYWNGPLAATDTAMPDINTWTQCVAVDPSGKQVGDSIQVPCNTQKSVWAKIVGLDHFYHFRLNATEAAAFYQGAGSMPVKHGTYISRDSVLAGDYGVLVAMHVTTREITDWTWQTFWWTPAWQQNPLASDQPATVQGVFKNYAMKTAYYMTVPTGPAKGQDEVTFNPYLEPDLAPQGKLSNCMTCHRAAAWNGTPYVFNGQLSPSDTIFNGTTKLDFLWSIQGNAH
ncbi:MAG TPA: hypothetical protein VFH27_09110 [Longimicrobiaceae bacterium]|nr:hypothetical protein [Longimicrobiaceae bacterium]